MQRKIYKREREDTVRGREKKSEREREGKHWLSNSGTSGMGITVHN